MLCLVLFYRSDKTSLPTGYINFTDVKASEGAIRTKLKGKKGIYLWTHSDGRQYVGSSKDLSSRLGGHLGCNRYRGP